MSTVELQGWSIYNLALKEAWWSKLLAYILMPVFLLDFRLTWKHNEAVLRGDTTTNISTISTKLLGLLAYPIMRWFF